MNIDPHPSYPNPSIVEAVCEIRLSLPDEASWEPSIAGKFFIEVQDKFPILEPIQTLGIHVELAPDRVGQQLVATQTQSRFKSFDGHRLINLGENTLSVNVLPRYAGWADLRSLIEYAWEKAISVIRPVSVNRIGLRYINAIPISSTDETIGTWLKQSKFLAPALLESSGTSFYRGDFAITQHDRISITVVNQGANIASDANQLVLDIDRSSLSVLNDLSVQSVLRKADELHEDVWNAFSQSCSPQLIDLLNRQA